jgi:transcriptional regulator with XRE-family HTH domain
MCARNLARMSKQHVPWPQYLKAAMEAAGYPRATDLARALGVNDSVVSRWLRGQSQTEMAMLRRLSKLLKRPLPELIVAAGYAEPSEMRMTTAPTPPEPPVGAGVDPELLADAEQLSPAEVQRVRDFIKGIRGT